MASVEQYYNDLWRAIGADPVSGRAADVDVDNLLIALMQVVAGVVTEAVQDKATEAELCLRLGIALGANINAIRASEAKETRQ